MAQQVVNSTYRLRNIGKGDKYLTLPTSTSGTIVIVKGPPADDTQKVH